MRKILIILSIILYAFSVFAQADSMVVFQICDDVDLSDSLLVQKLTLRSKSILFQAGYDKDVSRMVKMASEYGNCLKITDFCFEGFEDAPQACPFGLKGDVYRIDSKSLDSLRLLANQYHENRPNWMKKRKLKYWIKKDEYWANLGFDCSVGIEKKERASLREEFLVGLPVDSISKSHLEIGFVEGGDYLLFGSVGVEVAVYVYDGASFKLSVNNKAGWLLGFGSLNYDYPSIKLHARRSNIWLTSSLGREFTHVFTQGGGFYRTIDYRLDLGLRVFKKSHSANEISVPIRFDDELPVFFTGVLFIHSYRF